MIGYSILELKIYVRPLFNYAALHEIEKSIKIYNRIIKISLIKNKLEI